MAKVAAARSRRPEATLAYPSAGNVAPCDAQLAGGELAADCC
jgi:hypothetical protein